MGEKLKKFEEKKFNGEWKKYLSDSLLEKLNKTKKYYQDLGHELKELGRDILNDFKQPFMMGVLIFGVLDLGLWNYVEKHHNATNPKKPIEIVREFDENIKLVEKKLSKAEAGNVAKCRSLKDDYAQTINDLMQSDFYQNNDFDSQDEVVKQVAELLKNMNRNTQNLKYNYAAMVKESTVNLRLNDERIQQILSGKFTLSEGEKNFATQLGIYEFLDRQIAVRMHGSKDDLYQQDMLNDNVAMIKQFDDTKKIASAAKGLPAKTFGEICVRESLMKEVFMQSKFNRGLSNLEARGYHVDEILGAARSMLNRDQVVEADAMIIR